MFMFLKRLFKSKKTKEPDTSEKNFSKEEPRQDSSGNKEKNKNIIEEDKNTMPIEIKEETQKPQNRPGENEGDLITGKWKPESVDVAGFGKNKNARVIAIANQKGGVGKSTTAVNLCGYLGQLGYKTLIIDFDPQSNSTSGLGLDKNHIRKSIYELIILNEDPWEAIIETPYKNLFVIPSSIQLAGAEVELVSAMKREYKLKQIIDRIKNSFDFIVIDCPPALGLLTINALTSAGEVLIPIQCEYYALEGLGQLINTINLIKENLNENLKITGVVMTMYDSRTRLSEQVIDEVRAYFPDKVYDTIIPRNVRLSEAPSYGKPIIDYDPECKGAIAYKNLTGEVVKNEPK
jgi:chromosome partitioning protein